MIQATDPRLLVHATPEQMFSIAAKLDLDTARMLAAPTVLWYGQDHLMR